jgi:hypothetical protein
MTSAEGIASYRGQRQAVEICRAVSASDFAAAEKMYRAEAAAGVLRELVSGLSLIAVSLARAVAAHDETLDEDALWQGLADRAETAILATAEIDKLTGDEAGQ